MKSTVCLKYFVIYCRLIFEIQKIELHEFFCLTSLLNGFFPTISLLRLVTWDSESFYYCFLTYTILIIRSLQISLSFLRLGYQELVVYDKTLSNQKIPFIKVALNLTFFEFQIFLKGILLLPNITSFYDCFTTCVYSAVSSITINATTINTDAATTIKASSYSTAFAATTSNTTNISATISSKI